MSAFAYLVYQCAECDFVTGLTDRADAHEEATGHAIGLAEVTS